MNGRSTRKPGPGAHAARAARGAALALAVAVCACSGSSPPPAAGSGSGSSSMASSGAGAGDSSVSASDASGSTPGSDSASPESAASSGASPFGDDASTATGEASASPVVDTGISATPEGGSPVPEASTRTGGFVHPGLLLLQADLDRIRSKVAAGAAPSSTAWAAIKNTDAGTGYQPSVVPTVIDSYALQNEGHAAWVLAIKWVASGDMAYAVAAKRILDAWVNTVTSMQTTTLRTGVGAVQMANAAEIMAFGFGGAAAWPTPQVTKARTWFKDVVWPRIGMANAQRSSNWGTSAMAGCMATALFADDPVKFDYTVSAFKNGFTDAPDGCSGVTQYVCEPTGQPIEAGRDQGHAQGGVAHLVEVAMMGWNQGETDLVSYASARVVAGMEYLAKYNLMNDVPYDANFPDPCHVHPRWMVISPLLRGSFSPVYEMSNKLFTLAGLPHPYTTQVLSSPGYEPETTNTDHCGLGTLIMR